MLAMWDAGLDRVFDDVMGSMLGTARNLRTFDPAIDVRTNDDAIVFVCDVPGIKQDDLEVTLENGVLTIRGTRKFESGNGEQVVLGRAYGAFSRSFTLPEYVDENNLSAELADGVLTIRVGKHPKAKPRRIQIGAPPKQLKE
jgi:HSP20 family protein